jgi:hypothetical protein
MYLRRTTSVAAGNGLGATAKYLPGVTGIGLGTTAKYLRQTTSAAAGNGLGATAKYLPGVTGIGLGTTIKYLRRTTSAAAENGLPCGVAAFVVKSEPHTWARPSVRGCVGPALTHCAHKQRCLILSSEKEC